MFLGFWRGRLHAIRVQKAVFVLPIAFARSAFAQADLLYFRRQSVSGAFQTGPRASAG